MSDLQRVLSDLPALIFSPWYIGGVVFVLILSLFTNEGRIGRIACRVGLHDTHEVPGYPGRIRVVCIRCRKRFEVSV